jgi:hypothetical protein
MKIKEAVRLAFMVSRTASFLLPLEYHSKQSTREDKARVWVRILNG